MIGGIRGQLTQKNPPHLLLETKSGVCYEIEAPMSTFYQLPDMGSEVFLHTHFVVREDAQLLYGFFNPNERHLFRLLIKVNGIGPKVALAFLSSLSPDELSNALMPMIVQPWCASPVWVKKTAERLVIEMQDKMGHLTAPSTETPVFSDLSVTPANLSPTREAMTALVALGYKPALASKMISHIATDGKSSEEIIRLALKGSC